jgi:hypothetical protein
MVDLFGGRQEVRIDLMKSPPEAGERPQMGVDRRAAKF